MKDDLQNKGRKSKSMEVIDQTIDTVNRILSEKVRSSKFFPEYDSKWGLDFGLRPSLPASALVSGGVLSINIR